jgi:hypothetical protein
MVIAICQTLVTASGLTFRRAFADNRKADP